MYGSCHLLVCPSFQQHPLTADLSKICHAVFTLPVHSQNEKRREKVVHPATCHNKLPVCCCCIESHLWIHTHTPTRTHPHAHTHTHTHSTHTHTHTHPHAHTPPHTHTHTHHTRTHTPTHTHTHTHTPHTQKHHTHTPTHHTSLSTVCTSTYHNNHFESFSFEHSAAADNEKGGVEYKRRNSEAWAGIWERQIDWRILFQ